MSDGASLGPRCRLELGSLVDVRLRLHISEFDLVGDGSRGGQISDDLGCVGSLRIACECEKGA